MPRKNSGRPAPRPAAAQVRPMPKPAPQPMHHAPATPQPVHPAPSPAPIQSGGGGSMLGGIAGTIAEGMAFGTGSAIAHRAVDAVVGPRVVQHEHNVMEAPAVAPASTPSAAAVGSDSCSYQSRSLQDCISSNGNDISKCQFYLDMLNECRKSSSMIL
eukprot:c18296_g1_i1 orf=878-1351(-)